MGFQCIIRENFAYVRGNTRKKRYYRVQALYHSTHHYIHISVIIIITQRGTVVFIDNQSFTLLINVSTPPFATCTLDTDFRNFSEI